MSRRLLLHICNTFFENELERNNELHLAAWMRSHPTVRQLQTLPLLYAEPNDLILVSDLPPNPDPRLRLIESPATAERIEDWGPSLAISAWARDNRIPYSYPAWETVRMINSKIFSFSHSPKLPNAALLHSEKEALFWIEKTPGPKVLKTPFGTAGRGHFHIPGKGLLSSFLQKEFAKGLPLIGEPWVERVLDFSTQWKDGRLLGATRFETTQKGSYRATLAGPQSELFASYEWAIEEHLAAASPLIDKIRDMGFFGHLGIDAYVYLWNGKHLLQPIVEINGRKTMSWVALQIQKEKYPDQCCRFSFTPAEGISHAPFSVSA